MSDPVLEFSWLGELGPLALGRGEDAVAFCLRITQSNRGERRFNRVGGSQMAPNARLGSRKRPRGHRDLSSNYRTLLVLRPTVGVLLFALVICSESVFHFATCTFLSAVLAEMHMQHCCLKSSTFVMP